MLSVATQGLALDPQRVMLHHYAAHALSVRGRVAEALVHSREAIRLAPGDPLMQYQHASLKLNASEYREGWVGYNLIYAFPAVRLMKVFPDFPVWNGEPVAGHSFLLVGEDGRGDEIQFVRFAEWLNQQGAVVDVLVSEPVAENCCRHDRCSVSSNPVFCSRFPAQHGSQYRKASESVRAKRYQKRSICTRSDRLLTAFPIRSQYCTR
jgi:hypothetical protein